jgi:hypothetical protein
MRRRLGAPCLALALAVAGCRAGGGPTADTAVRTYLRAIETNDAKAAYGVVSRGDRGELRARVRRFGGTAAVSVRILEPVRPGAGRTVLLVFRPAGAAEVEDEVAAHPRSGRWYIVFPTDRRCEPGAVCVTP